ncbi:MAG: hydroxyacylglutathione hydrolase [Legionellaceae bacterium]|nr:hydroxyacylglutathione hydrolase [Legionellaceae bacterium]
MFIQPIPIFQDNYIWLIINPKNKSVIAVDPGDAKPLLHFLKENQLLLDAIFITHHHADHTGGISELLNHFSVNVYGPKSENIAGVSHPVSEPDLFALSSVNKSNHSETAIMDSVSVVEVLDLPGHTLGHIAYYIPGHLFCGDTLFSAGCGRIFEGTPEQMFRSLQKIRALPNDTNIYCTHEYTLQNLKFAQTVEPSNQKIRNKLQGVLELGRSNIPTLPTLLRIEKQVNPFLRCHVKEVVFHVEQHFGLKFSDSVHVFQYLREWKNHFTG